MFSFMAYDSYIYYRQQNTLQANFFKSRRHCIFLFLFIFACMSSWKFVALAGLEDRQMEVGEDFTESIFICCGYALLSTFLVWFLIIWTLTTASHMQVTSAESYRGHWNKVTDHWLYSIYRGATWLTACFWQERRASCGSNNDQRLKLYGVLLLPWWLG